MVVRARNLDIPRHISDYRMRVHTHTRFDTHAHAHAFRSSVRHISPLVSRHSPLPLARAPQALRALRSVRMRRWQRAPAISASRSSSSSTLQAPYRRPVCWPWVEPGSGVLWIGVSLCVAVFALHAAFFLSLGTATPLRGAGKKKKQDSDVSVALRPYFFGAAVSVRFSSLIRNKRNSAVLAVFASYDATKTPLLYCGLGRARLKYFKKQKAGPFGAAALQGIGDRGRKEGGAPRR